jgi:PTH1 family peptidyl-tRNA hydrolase
MAIRLIAGLGNPGREHERDRHNVGFWLVGRLAQAHGASLRKDPKYQALVARIPAPVGDVWLCAPQTYMNLSGRSVGGLSRFYKLAPEDILVVHDELDFPPGVARLKLGGGVAGHNGLKDIQAQLGTQGFWRLRIGIGHPGDRDVVADYVLNAPPTAERELIEDAVARSLEVLPLVLAGDMHGAMQKLHGGPEKPKAKGEGPPAKPPLPPTQAKE